MRFPSLNRLFRKSVPDREFHLFLKTTLDFPPGQYDFYHQAFTHSSLSLKDKQGAAFNFERLEFLGDSVLSLVISDYLFHRHKHSDEGILSSLRSTLVQRKHLNTIGKKLNLIGFLKTNIDKSKFGENIHGNLIEALIGAIYLDKGFAHCKQFSETHIIKKVEKSMKQGAPFNYKGKVIEHCQRHNIFCYYNTSKVLESEPATFRSQLTLGNEVFKGKGHSKKKAEQKASKKAYIHICLPPAAAASQAKMVLPHEKNL